MGAAYFIVLEREIDGLDTMMDGKRLSRNMDSLDEVARELGVQPLSGFFSMPPESWADFMDDADGVEVPESLQLKQFSAQEGLATVRALLPRPEAQAVIQDLEDCERILSTAAEQGVGWHFQIDV